MALICDYYSDRFQNEFVEAYIRIDQGSFNNKFIDLIVGIYPSSDLRDEEKRQEAIREQLDNTREEIKKLDNEQKKMRRKLQDKENFWKELEIKFTEGRAKESEVKKAKDEFHNYFDEIHKKTIQILPLTEIADDLEEQVLSLPAISPIELKKYTFPLSQDAIEENGLFKLLYGILKEIPDFSKNVQDV